jgi:phosphatidylglycerol---prolipoprotein diacylglyceryl transferase
MGGATRLFAASSSCDPAVRQTLFIIPHEFLGISVFGFGWVLMVWGAGSVIALLWQWRRHGWSADTQSLLFFLAAVGAVIAFALPMVEAAQDGFLPEAGEAESPRGLPIRGYGVMLLLAVASGVGLAAWRARRMGMDPELIYSLAFWMFLFGILGARLFFVIEYWDDFQRDTLSATLLAIVNVTQGGLVVYGSVIGGLAAGAIFIRRRGLPLWATADLIAPSMVLGLALGRFGCFLNGCCFGGVCDLPWAVQFPERSPPYQRQLQTGQLHGFRIAANEKGEPAAVQVDRASAAALAGLKEEDVIHSIQLPPGDAVRAAAMTRAFAGRPIELQRARGGDVRLTIPAENDRGGGPGNRLGMRVFQAPGGPAVVSQVTVGGPADRAGIETGDTLREVRLPPTPTAAIAQSVMQWSGRQVTLVTERGPIGWVQESVPERSLPVHPTQLYSVINALLLFFFLWVYYPFRTRDGEVFAVLLTIYPITRFLLEAIRIDEPSQFGTGLSISQLVSLGVLVAAAALWIYLFRRPAGSVLPLHAGAAFRPHASASGWVPR